MTLDLERPAGIEQQATARGRAVSTALVIVVAWLLFHLLLAAAHDTPILTGGLLGPDSYMRLVRVEALLESGAWYDHRIERSNAPFGEELHWTRPFDLLLLAGATPLAPLLGWKTALYWSGALVSPLLQLLSALAFAWALCPLIRPGLWLLPTIALLIQPAAAATGLPGRADHHALFLLVFVLQWGFLLRALIDRRDRMSAIWAGALGGFSLWLSVEFILSAGLAVSGLAIAWLLDPEGRARQNARHALGFFLVIAAAVAAEYPPWEVLRVAYDKVSAVHLLLAGELLVFWAVLHGPLPRRCAAALAHLPGRLLIALIGAVLATAPLVLFFTPFFAGPMAEVDPRVVPIWLDKVLEMRDLIPRDRESLGDAIVYLGHLTIALPFLVWRIKQVQGIGARLPWIVLTLAIVAFSLTAFLHLRFAAFAEVLILFAVAAFIDSAFAAAGGIRSDVQRGLVRGGVMALLLVGPLIAGKAIANSGLEGFAERDAPATANTVCDVGAMTRHMEAVHTDPEEAAIVLAFMDLGPQILYRSRLGVIGTPYHRNGAGIIDGHAMLASEDDGAAREMMRARGVDFVLLCPGSAERAFYSDRDSKSRLYDRLAAGEPPAWLRSLALPPLLTETFMLYRVDTTGGIDRSS
jgi:hypothetical protein